MLEWARVPSAAVARPEAAGDLARGQPPVPALAPAAAIFPIPTPVIGPAPVPILLPRLLLLLLRSARPLGRRGLLLLLGSVGRQVVPSRRRLLLLHQVGRLLLGRRRRLGHDVGDLLLLLRRGVLSCLLRLLWVLCD